MNLRNLSQLLTQKLSQHKSMNLQIESPQYLGLILIFLLHITSSIYTTIVKNNYFIIIDIV